MNVKGSGTCLRPGGAKPPRPGGGTQVFPVPPRAAERGTPGPAAGSASTPEVSVLTTVGVGGAPSTAQPPARPPRRTKPAHDVNEPTRIFVLSPGASAEGDAPAKAEVSRQTATFASPPFAPVPAVIRTRAPQIAGSSIALAAAQPKVDPRPAAPTSAAPLLRAFDDVRGG
jgi:hypothetical protein